MKSELGRICQTSNTSRQVNGLSVSQNDEMEVLLLFYVLAIVAGFGIITLMPTPAVADFVGEILNFITFCLLAIFMVQKAIQLFQWIKVKRRQS